MLCLTKLTTKRKHFHTTLPSPEKNDVLPLDMFHFRHNTECSKIRIPQHSLSSHLPRQAKWTLNLHCLGSPSSPPTCQANHIN